MRRTVGTTTAAALAYVRRQCGRPIFEGTGSRFRAGQLESGEPRFHTAVSELVKFRILDTEQMPDGAHGVFTVEAVEE